MRPLRTAPDGAPTSRTGALVDILSRSRWSWLLLLPLGVLLWLMGRAVGVGGTPQVIALAVAGGILLSVLGAVFLVRRVGWGALALEVPVLLLLLSTLVFRQRSATDLAGDPLDLAAQVRVAAVAVAGILGLFALLWGQKAGAGQRVTTLPLRLFAIYVVIVFLGALGSVDPLLTAYRGLELAAGLIVMVGARRSLGEQAGPRIEALLYWFAVAALASVWINVLLLPDQAIIHLENPTVPVKLQIQGVYPSIAANGVGLLGVIVAAWSPARIRGGASPQGLSRPVAYLLTSVGAFTLLAAQYRTGYVALAAVVAVYVLVRGKKLLATLLVGAAIGIAIWAPYATREAEPFLLRGQSVEQAGELSSRTLYWRTAIPVWQSSPLIGRGLLTASRFEVLAPLGLQYTAGIHGTWPEALVGTGIIGTSLLAMAFLITIRRAFREARTTGWMAPLALLTVLGVRSVTGPTFESFSYTAMLFLWLMLSMEDVGRSTLPRAEEVRGRETGRAFAGSAQTPAP
jgi:O-antigen ligase